MMLDEQTGGCAVASRAESSPPQRSLPSASRRPQRREPESALGSAEPIGALLTRLRLGQGLSQLRLAELLCAASNTPTVTRHEISRWERGERIPGEFWLGWLSVVLEAPLERLEAAAAATRQPSAADRARATGPAAPLGQPLGPADLLAGLDHGPVSDVRELAHAWLALPGRPSGGISSGRLVRTREPTQRLAALESRLADLRRIDDQVGGADLAGIVDPELRAAIGVLREVSGVRPRRRGYRLIAGYAQLAGWVYADAGALIPAVRAYRMALHAATAANDRMFGAYVLGSLSHLRLAAGEPTEALLLAQTGYTAARTDGSPLTRALLLHRIALASAQARERRSAELALADAHRAADQAQPDQEPPWLYWLDQRELTAMTGRCWTALGRPLRASQHLPEHFLPGTGPRTVALYSLWRVRCLLALGEVERGCHLATLTLKRIVAAGSVRAVEALRRLHPLLLRHRDVPVVRRYERRVAAIRDYLPAPERGAVGLPGPRLVYTTGSGDARDDNPPERHASVTV